MLQQHGAKIALDILPYLSDDILISVCRIFHQVGSFVQVSKKKCRPIDNSFDHGQFLSRRNDDDSPDCAKVEILIQSGHILDPYRQRYELLLHAMFWGIPSQIALHTDIVFQERLEYESVLSKGNVGDMPLGDISRGDGDLATRVSADDVVPQG